MPTTKNLSSELDETWRTRLGEWFFCAAALSVPGGLLLVLAGQGAGLALAGVCFCGCIWTWCCDSVIQDRRTAEREAELRSAVATYAVDVVPTAAETTISDFEKTWRSTLAKWLFFIAYLGGLGGIAESRWDWIVFAGICLWGCIAALRREDALLHRRIAELDKRQRPGYASDV